MAHELAELDGFSLLCGRYEGVDERSANICATARSRLTSSSPVERSPQP